MEVDKEINKEENNNDEELEKEEELSSVSEIPNEQLNEKLDLIMSKLEQLNIEKEIGEKEKKSETRVIIDTIELYNFKSYADKKVIGPLHYRFNAVVGPNGSGKSNLMESLLFVFGKRAKKMRLNKLSELIHNSSTKQSCSSAKVTINFREIKETGNSYEYLPDGDFTLAREVFKNSTSKYTLNNKEISFEELSKILNKKGIDLKHNRFLILQGEVEQIAMMKQKAANPNETGLLEFLEDIIGTNRYVSLIEKLNRSIEELSEIKSSKASRVKIAKNELDQLEDVKNASTEYYHKEKELLVIRHLDMNVKKEISRRKADEKRKQIDGLKQNMEKIDNEIKEKIQANTTILAEHRRIRGEQEEFKKKKDDLLRQSEQFDEEDKAGRNDIDMCLKTVKKIDLQLEKQNKAYQMQNENISTAKDELPKLKVTLEEYKASYAKLNEEIEDKEKDFSTNNSLESRKKVLQNKLQPSESEINTNTFKITQNNETINLISEKVSSIQKACDELTEKRTQFEAALAEKKKEYRKLSSKVTEGEEMKEKNVSLVEEKSKIVEEKYHKVQNLLTRLSDIKSSNFERSAKDKILQSLLRAQNEGTLSGILGRLGDLGSIDLKYDTAITTACGYLDSIVVEKVPDAQRAVDYLKKNQIGQATFLILDKIRWVEKNLKRNFNAPQDTQRLFDLVKFNNSNLENAFYFALRDTLVAPDIKVAKKVAYGPTRQRVVTLTGELIEVYGTMSGGGKARRGGMSNVERNYAKNDEEVKSLNDQYNKALKEYEMLKIELNGMETNSNKVNSILQENYVLKSKFENDISGLEKVLKENEAQLENATKDLNKYSKELKKINELKSENEKLAKRNESLINQTKGLRNELDEIDNERNRIMGEDFGKKREERNQKKKTIDELEKKINNYENILKNANKDLEKIKVEIERKQKEKNEYNDKIEKLKQKLKELEDKALVVYGEIENCEKAINDLEEQFNTKNTEVENLKKIINEMKENKKSIDAEIREATDELKKINRTTLMFDGDIDKNKESYNKLIDEFGFIEEFDEEIKKINATKKEEESDEEEEEKENEDEEKKEGSGKKKKETLSKYAKYFQEKTLRDTFSDSEMNELISINKELAYEYTMLQTKVNDMKPNMGAILQYKQTLISLRERENDLTQTIEKLKKANEIFSNVKTRRYNEFMDGFNLISAKLKEMYQIITTGGDAELELVDTLDPFSEGISFSVRPFKKSWKVITNLSGGEKTLASLSLIFALHHYKPSPLYVLDEIDAALDFRNVSIIANYIKEQTMDSQFIIISLRNHMFELANKLVGIYKTFDITKTITFDPTSYDVTGETKEEEKNPEKS